ncbi:DNA-binding protein [Enterococcus thailandicus]|uniref:DNA-binding protein n=1 Tax=Enterococcus thailandicus TaxID=417368 RepID=UPI00288F5E4F|nr:DNA-binding protein [Enterococcus thailandicus]MDT2753219.1 DNA-binding protein [Enterococcus thailandicus]
MGLLCSVLKLCNRTKWGISERRIQKLCEENRIEGIEKFGRAWMIPKDAEKPIDGRLKFKNKQEDNHGI